MSSIENTAYNELMARIGPSNEERLMPTEAYAALMRHEAVNHNLYVSTVVPGILREPDWVHSKLRRGSDHRRSEAYITFMRLRQEAMAASDVMIEAVLAASAIDEIATISHVEPGFVRRQLARLRSTERCVVHVVPTTFVCSYLGQVSCRTIYIGSAESEPVGVYDEFPYDNPKEPHEKWYSPGSDCTRLYEAQVAFRDQFVGETA